MALSIECAPDQPSEPCTCCGGRTTSLTRFVYRDGDAHAIYYARFSDNHPDGIVQLAISLGEWGEDGGPENRTAFALEMRNGPAGYEVCVRDAAVSPWSEVELLGPMLDREVALAHPWIDEVFHITDHALLEDEPLRTYLNGVDAS